MLVNEIILYYDARSKKHQIAFHVLKLFSYQQMFISILLN